MDPNLPADRQNIADIPLEHECCDGECYHDDCCGKIPENCPNYQ